MRVLCVGNMYPPHHLGGYELMWHSAVRRMRARGHEARIVTTDFRVASPDPTIPEDPDVHRELRWYWHEHEFPQMNLRERLRLERHNAVCIERQLAEFRPDVVNWWAMGGMSLSLIERVRRNGVPAVGVVVDDWMVYGPQVDGWLRSCQRLGPLAALAGALTAIPARVRLDDAGEWVFVSERTRDAAVGAGWTVPRASIAHGGVDGELFRAAEPRAWAWRLLYVGRIDERKGIATAVRALAELPEASLTVLGSGDDGYLERLRGLVRDLGLERRITFEQRPRDAIPTAYDRHDAVLFPAIWEEPWGLVPLEAMASGRPVIATGVGGSGEYLRHEENCLIFQPRSDPAALAAAVRRLAEDEGLREHLRKGGLRTSARFSERAFNDAVVDAIERARA